MKEKLLEIVEYICIWVAIICLSLGLLLGFGILLLCILFSNYMGFIFGSIVSILLLINLIIYIYECLKEDY